MCVRARKCVFVCVRARAHVCVCVYVCVCVRARVCVYHVLISMLKGYNGCATIYHPLVGDQKESR